MEKTQFLLYYYDYFLSFSSYVVNFYHFSNFLSLEKYYLPKNDLGYFSYLSQCSSLCNLDEECTAFSVDQTNQICQIGQKGKAITATTTSSNSVSIYEKPGLKELFNNQSNHYSLIIQHIVSDP